jgi:hypothetical protein
MPDETNQPMPDVGASSSSSHLGPRSSQDADGAGQGSAKRAKLVFGSASLRVAMVQVLDIVERLAAGGYRPRIWTRAEVKRWCRDVVELALINKASLQKLQPWLQKIRRIKQLLDLYPQGQARFENHTQRGWLFHEERTRVQWFNPWLQTVQNIHPSPILIDIFMNHIPVPFVSQQSTETDDKPLTQHVPEIIELMPEAVVCAYGDWPCRDRVTPLIAAQWNEDIGTEWLEVLIRAGADPIGPIIINGRPVDVIEDMISNVRDLPYLAQRAELVRATLAKLQAPR